MNFVKNSLSISPYDFYNLEMKKPTKFWLYFLLAIKLLLDSSLSLAQIPDEAKAAFNSKNYDRALRYLRSYLKGSAQDFDSWSYLGVVYFHTGQPRKALKYLKYSENKTRDRATNHFYQGLSYFSLKNLVFAKRYFEKLSMSQTQWTEAATVELIFIDYHEKDYDKALTQIASYKRKFPRGALTEKVAILERTIESGEYDDKLEGFPKPDTTRALFRYSPLSLAALPHFWYVGLAGNYVQISDFVPSESGLKESGDENTQLIFRSSIGIGPIKKGDTSLLTGYTYNQSWTTTPERLQVFSEDPSDFSWQPFRTDLLKRDHQIFMELKSQLSRQIFGGVYASRTYSRVGSVLAGPEKASVEENLPVADTTTVTPWIGASFTKEWRLLGYWYFEKRLNLETPEQSYQTYSFTTSNTPVSIGLVSTIDFPEIKAQLKIEGFRFDLFFNNPFIDHVRNGGLISLTHTLFPTFYLNLDAGIYRDSYIETRTRSAGCNTIVSTTDSPKISNPKFCQRTDNGTLISGQVSWNYTQFNRVYFGIQKLSNQNASQKENQFEKLTFLGGLSLAFPAIDKVLRYTERFTDVALDRSMK